MPRRDSFDERLLHWIDDHRVAAISSFTTWMKDAGETPWVLAVVGLAIAAVIVRFRAWRLGFATALAGFIAGSAADALKTRIGRARPALPDVIVQVDGYAMPSSHSAALAGSSVALLKVVRWSSRKALVATAVVLGLGTVFIGAAMVYLGARWATDVLAGWALGALIGAASGLVFRPRASSV